MWKLFVLGVTFVPLMTATAQVRAGIQPTSRTSGHAPSTTKPISTVPISGVLNLPVPMAPNAYEVHLLFGPAEFSREIRDGKEVLVQTNFTLVVGRGGFWPTSTYKATGQWTYPTGTLLLSSGPYLNYVLIPLDSGQPRRTPLTGSTRTGASFTQLAGAVPSEAADPSRSTRVTSPKAINCGLQVHPKSAVLPHKVAVGLSCLALVPGQATTLPSGLKLLQRTETSVQVWREDVMELSGTLAIRDQQGRYWLLKALEP